MALRCCWLLAGWGWTGHLTEVNVEVATSDWDELDKCEIWWGQFGQDNNTCHVPQYSTTSRSDPSIALRIDIKSTSISVYSIRSQLRCAKRGCYHQHARRIGSTPSIWPFISPFAPFQKHQNSRYMLFRHALQRSKNVSLHRTFLPLARQLVMIARLSCRNLYIFLPEGFAPSTLLIFTDFKTSYSKSHVLRFQCQTVLRDVLSALLSFMNRGRLKSYRN